MPLDEAQNAIGISVAATLRSAGVATILYTEPGKIDKKLRFADRMGFRYAILIGAQEIEAGNVSVKDMIEGSTIPVSITDLVQHISLA
jgi:histidyl-tRNA synthetase